MLAKVRACLEAGDSVPSSFTNEYYSLIPTITGRAKPPSLDNFGILGEKEAQLEFWLRMGFEEMTSATKANPLEGLGDVACPPDLMHAASGVSDAVSISSSLQRGDALASAQAGAPSKRMDAQQ